MAEVKRRRRAKSLSGYFRRIFEENPQLLYTKSNDEIRARWLRDHPSHREMPKRAIQALNNVKSVLRKKVRDTDQGKPLFAVGRPTGSRGGARGLEVLEEFIDECLTMAKNLDRNGLESVIRHLRRARNEVVWKLGQ
jgi:hypothetical protein